MLSLPFALIGGLWLIWLLGHAVSIATLIGFIALAGVAAEFGIIMLLYLRQAWERQLAVNPEAGEAELDAAIREGAVQRVRPKAMTVAVILAGLFPILIGGGAGSRSEEHTSELQSLMRISYAVFCLKTKNIPQTDRTQ